MSDAESPDDVPGIEINVWDPKGGHRTCSQCGRDCAPEPVESDGRLRIAFICREHGIHSVVDPFEGER